MRLNEHIGFNYRISNFWNSERVLSIKRAAVGAPFYSQHARLSSRGCYFLSEGKKDKEVVKNEFLSRNFTNLKWIPAVQFLPHEL